MAGLILLEWAGLAAPGDIAPIVQSPQTRSATADAVADVAPHVDLLSRPLFTPGRRPPAERPLPTSAPGIAEAAPRLMGIMVSGITRHAIFAAPGRRPLTVREGDRVGAFLVNVINERNVVLQGPGGPHTLSPSADPTIRREFAYSPPPVPLIDPSRREVETENDQ